MDEKQKEYFEFLKNGIENDNLYQEGRRPTFLHEKPIQNFINKRNAALDGISIENFNKLLKDTQQYKNNNSYIKCVSSIKHSSRKDIHKLEEPNDKDSSTSSILGSATSAVGSAVGSATSATASGLGYAASAVVSTLGLKGGRKSLKIKRSARHKKSRSKSIKRRKSSKK
jgi:hypothetical protein